MLPVFTELTVAYGIGVWEAAGRRRALRTTGLVLLTSGATGIAWLPFPMSSRDVIAGGAATGGDTGHLVLSGLTVAEIQAACALRSRTACFVATGVVVMAGPAAWGLPVHVSPAASRWGFGTRPPCRGGGGWCPIPVRPSRR